MHACSLGSSASSHPNQRPPNARREYWNENIMIHEWAHTVMLLGFSSCQLALVDQLLAAAQSSGAYGQGIYMMADSNEVRAARCWPRPAAAHRCCSPLLTPRPAATLLGGAAPGHAQLPCCSPCCFMTMHSASMRSPPP
jgi:hypothetical protein